jgi:hypothetical protein
MGMGSLFNDEVGGAPVGDKVSAKDGALFPVDTQLQGAAMVQRSSPAALFPKDTADRFTPMPPVQKASVNALPLDDMPTVDQQKPFVSTSVSAPLLLNDSPTAPQATPKPVIQLTTIAPDAVPAPQRIIVSAPQPQEIFQEPEDPLVHKALQHAQEKYPDGFEHRKRMLKARFETLLPLDFDRISAFSAGTLPHVQVVMREVSESSQNLSAISVSTAIQEITTTARDAAGGSTTSHGFGGLLKRVEQSVRRFDPDAAQNTLMRLYGGVKSIHSRLAGIGDLAQETLAAIQMDVMVMGVIAYMAESTAFAQQAQRRHDLLLTTGQELQLAQKQLEALKAQTENALMQIEEVRTVTLPSLGFLGGIR